MVILDRYQRDIGGRVQKILGRLIKGALVDKQTVNGEVQRHAAASIEILELYLVEPALELGRARGCFGPSPGCEFRERHPAQLQCEAVIRDD